MNHAIIKCENGDIFAVGSNKRWQLGVQDKYQA